LSQVRNVDPTVAVVVDGVLQTTSLGFSKDLVDVQQIEVLKGPQGALYGRNATGGAINITTKQPGDEFEGYVRGGVGDGDSYSLTAAVSGPISEENCWAGWLFRTGMPMVGEKTRISQRWWIPMRILVFKASCCGLSVTM
jgi:iron complex outermembrane receptor protein